MTQVYCNCCNKKTAHKVVLKRSEQADTSLIGTLVCFFSTVVQGDHYVKMEKQYLCRACNHQNTPAPAAIPNMKVA